MSIMTKSTAIQSMPAKVTGVTVGRIVQGSSPALRVSWSAVNGSGINYTVCHSTTRGTQSNPPSGANCSTSGITGTSTTLGPLSIGTLYHIWVAAVSSGRQGPYSDRKQGRTFQGIYVVDKRQKYQIRVLPALDVLKTARI